MFCTSCGAANPDDAAFCAKCGRPLLPAPAAADKTPDSGAATATPGGRYAPSATTLDDSPRMGSRGDAGAITEEEAWSAYIGERNTAYYLDRFERMKNGGSARWHWPSFFACWYWMLYRKLWVPALVYFLLVNVVPFVLQVVVVVMAAKSAAGAMAGLGFLWFLLMVAWLFLPSMLANQLVYGKAKKVIARARAAGGTRERVLMRITGDGGTSSIVVIIILALGIVMSIGILAAVALPAYQTYTLKSKVGEAQGMGNAVTAAVGRTYEETGALPTDIDATARSVNASSRYVTGLHMDPGNGIVTLDVMVDPRHEGHLVFLPHADEKRHVTWQCTTPDLQKLVTASCRSETPSTQQ